MKKLLLLLSCSVIFVNLKAEFDVRLKTNGGISKIQERDKFGFYLFDDHLIMPSGFLGLGIENKFNNW